MIHEGKFKIGTLCNYRDTEKHGSARGDKDEGAASTYDIVSDYSSGQLAGGTPQGLSDFTAKNFFGNCRYGTINIHGSVVFEAERTSRNLLVYCVSRILSKQVMEGMKYDACVEITDAARFFGAITASIESSRGKLSAKAFGNCEYCSRKQHHSVNTTTHPAFIKDESFSYQAETRMAWEPIDNEISDFVLICPEATRFCKLVQCA